MRSPQSHRHDHVTIISNERRTFKAASCFIHRCLCVINSRESFESGVYSACAVREGQVPANNHNMLITSEATVFTRAHNLSFKLDSIAKCAPATGTCFLASLAHLEILSPSRKTSSNIQQPLLTFVLRHEKGRGGWEGGEGRERLKIVLT